MAGEPTPALTGSDASLLDGLVELPRRRWLRLDVWIEHVDWLERWVPAFDDVSYGLPRLIAAGYAEVRRERARASGSRDAPYDRAPAVDQGSVACRRDRGASVGCAAGRGPEPRSVARPRARGLGCSRSGHTATRGMTQGPLLAGCSWSMAILVGIAIAIRWLFAPSATAAIAAETALYSRGAYEIAGRRCRTRRGECERPFGPRTPPSTRVASIGRTRRVGTSPTTRVASARRSCR